MSDDIGTGTIEIDTQDVGPNPIKEELRSVLALLSEPPYHRPPHLEDAKAALKEILEDL